MILKTSEPFRDQLTGIVVESTFNWYWLIDGLMGAGYRCVHLANPSAMKQHEGIKHTDDQHDAIFRSDAVPKESVPMKLEGLLSKIYSSY